MDWNMFCSSITSTIRSMWLDPTYATAAVDDGKDDEACVSYKMDDWTIDDTNSNSKILMRRKKKIQMGLM